MMEKCRWGKRHGQGTDTFRDGEKYVGEWKNNRKNGQGTMTYSDGTKYVGEWEKGKRWEGKQFNKTGKINEIYFLGRKKKYFEKPICITNNRIRHIIRI